MTAVVLPFPANNPQAVFEATSFQNEQNAKDAKALRQARLIRSAEQGTELALWLAFLTVMPKADRAKMGAVLALRAVHGEEDVERALAFVNLASATPEQRAVVVDLIDRMGGGVQ